MVVSLHVILTIVCTEPICTVQEGHSIVICRGGEQYTSTYTMYCMHRIHARKRTQQGYLTCGPHIHRRSILYLCMYVLGTTGQHDHIGTFLRFHGMDGSQAPISGLWLVARLAGGGVSFWASRVLKS